MGKVFAYILVLAGFMLGLAAPVSAHESRPVFIDIVETDVNLFSVGWQVPPSVPDFNYPSVVLPESCEAIAPERIIPGSGAYARQRVDLHLALGGSFEPMGSVAQDQSPLPN